MYSSGRILALLEAFNRMRSSYCYTLQHSSTTLKVSPYIKIWQNLVPWVFCVSLIPDNCCFICVCVCMCVCRSVCLSFNNQAGFVSISFWFGLFIAKRDKKLRLLTAFELNVVGKVPSGWQEFLQMNAAVLFSCFDFSITSGIYCRLHFSKTLKYWSPFPFSLRTVCLQLN